MPMSYNRISARGLDRISALSDGLFAIAMTLIVLEIRVPDPGRITTDAELWNALLTLGPKIVTYLLSFLTLGIFWGGQQTQLNPPRSRRSQPDLDPPCLPGRRRHDAVHHVLAG
jgi:uncharacterized membrane protein